MSTNNSKSGSSCSDEVEDTFYDDDQLRRGPWTVDEDKLLIRYIHSHGEGRWNLLAKRSGLKRSGKSCRLRWLNYLKPDVKRGNLSPQEQLLILQLHSELGNRWSKIVQHLPGRTDNEIKNYWRTRVQKQARHLNVDSNGTAFKEVIRCLWIPHLLQKIHGSSSLDAPSNNLAETKVPLNETSPPVPLELSQDIHLKNSISPSISSSDQSIYSNSEFPMSDLKDFPPSSFYDNVRCDVMGTFGVDDVSSAMGEFLEPMCDYHVVENNIGDDDAEVSFWNIDELW